MSEWRPNFEQLLYANQSMVFGLALHFLRERTAAEEIAQDVFLGLHNNLRNVTSEEHARYWLRRVTLQRCIDHVRRKPAVAVPIDEIQDVGVDPPQNDVFVRERLRKLIATLSPDARAVMILRYQEDLSPPEIAATLSMPVATVKSHLQRSLALLREKMSRSSNGTRNGSMVKE